MISYILRGVAAVYITIILYSFVGGTAVSGSAISTSLTNFFNKMGVLSNVTPPNYFEDQSAGYATGGGMSFSGNVMDTSLAHVEMPSIRYGNCGDIDIYNGGISFVSGDQIVRTLKSVASSAAGYAFMLALETVSPQIANNIKQLQSWANTINGIGINSCETAASIVSAVWPRAQGASQAICRSSAASGGIMRDYIDARHGCSEPTTYKSRMDKEEGNNPNILKDEFNIAWKVIHDDPFFSGVGAEQLKYLFMSITGTVVAKKQPGGALKVSAYHSKVFDEKFMQKLMEGGGTPIYRCGDSGLTSKCLDVSETTVVIDANLAMKSKVERILKQMQHKVITDETLSDEEKALLNKTRLPLLRILNVMSAYRQGAAPLSLSEYADAVAIDMVCQYIRNVLDVIRLNISRKMQIQFDSTVLERYEDSLNRVEARVREYEHKTQKIMDQLLAIERKLNLLEKDIFSRIRAMSR
jgi:conjugative transfer pilus assembly protein TraH